MTAALAGPRRWPEAARGGDRLSDFDWSRVATGGAAARDDSFTGLQPAMSSGLEAMISSAPPEIQKELRVMSAFRSPETQERLWQAALKKYGSASAARKWVAPPGRSQHGEGNAIDWKFASKSARDWAHKNAAKFGFAFPLAHEPWHMEVAGARGGGGGPPVRQNASGIGVPLDSTGGGAGGVGVPAVAEALMGMRGPQQQVADRRCRSGSSLAAAGMPHLDPAAKDDPLLRRSRCSPSVPPVARPRTAQAQPSSAVARPMSGHPRRHCRPCAPQRPP